MKIRNTGKGTRSLSVFSYVEFSFHHIEIDNQNLQMSLYASGSSYADGIIEYDFFYEPWTFHYFASDFTPDSFDCVRDTFLGNYRTESNPSAVERGECHNSNELGGNHCASLHKRITLAPGEEQRLLFMLGVGRPGGGEGDENKVLVAWAGRQGVRRTREYWERKPRSPPMPHPSQGDGHDAQYVDAPAG